MKRTFIILLSLTTYYMAFSQYANVVNAYNYWQAGELDKAKVAIDNAITHDQTSQSAKTWFYRGEIHYTIMVSSIPAYRMLDTNAARTSYESYNRSLELDEGNRYERDIKSKLPIIQNISLNNGVVHFNDKNYEKAYTLFVTSVDIANLLGMTDSLAIYNCGLTSERMEKTDQAIQWYEKCIQIGYRAPNMCSFIINLLQRSGQDDVAFAKTHACRSQFPANQSLIITELNYFLKFGMFEAAERNLKQALMHDPNNEIFYFSLGSVYDNQGKVQEALDAYLKALEIKPEYFDANYNTGALFFNAGVEVNNSMDADISEEEANRLNNETTRLFNNALSYLEMAHKMKPEDRNTLQSLKMLYARLGDTTNYNKIDALLNN